MEHTAVFEEQISLTPTDLRSEIKDIDAVLQEKFRKRIEGKCSRHGFVIPDTLKILSRSMGMLERGRFTGNIIFRVQAEGDVLNPPDGAVIKGEVIRKNKMGLYVNHRDAIRVIVPRDMNIGDEAFDGVEVGQIVNVEIKKSRFQVNDEYILSVGAFRSADKKGEDAVPAKTPAVKAVNVEAVPEEDEEAEEDLEDAEDDLEEAEEELEETEETLEEAEEDEEAPPEPSAQRSNNSASMKNQIVGNAYPGTTA
jgi:DNA-directed RNA polymerase subunit E'/Rpb7